MKNKQLIKEIKKSIESGNKEEVEQFLSKNKDIINKEEMKFLIDVADCADQEEILDLLNTTTSSNESHNSSIENDKHFESIKVMDKINAENSNKSAFHYLQDFKNTSFAESNKFFSDLRLQLGEEGINEIYAFILNRVTLEKLPNIFVESIKKLQNTDLATIEENEQKIQKIINFKLDYAVMDNNFALITSLFNNFEQLTSRKHDNSLIGYALRSDDPQSVLKILKATGFSISNSDQVDKSLILDIEGALAEGRNLKAITQCFETLEIKPDTIHDYFIQSGVEQEDLECLGNEGIVNNFQEQF